MKQQDARLWLLDLIVRLYLYDLCAHFSVSELLRHKYLYSFHLLIRLYPLFHFFFFGSNGSAHEVTKGPSVEQVLLSTGLHR